MLKGQSNKSTKVSDFYQGENIFSQLKNSLFGQIENIFEQVLSDNTKENYQLPKVIVIGTESSGKSSLLERITKCQIFPRDGKLCTKCPIKVKLVSVNYASSSYSVKLPNKPIQNLNNKKDIYPIVQKYMNDLPNDIISQDEIIINIIDKDVPDFEFYDLPGIRTYPPEAATMTVKICKKYLSDKNSIVLCVVPCTTTRLTSCQSIALIKEAKMEHNTILALTMTDRLQQENFDELLINRIINNTDELNGIKFANCIAVINRSNSDKYSLEESDKLEKDWFDKNIYQCIPDEDEKFREKIIQNTTISNLLKNMDNLYNHFIKNEWIPRMICEMHLKEEIIKKELKTLEPVITEDNFPEFKSLCLDFNGTYTYVDGTPTKKVNIHVPTKYFIGAIPIQPSDFFAYRSIKLIIPKDGDGSDKLVCHIPSMSFFGNEGCLSAVLDPQIDRTGNNRLCNALQWYDTFFSNFYDRITISYVLKDNIFNIPVKRFINIRKKFDELFFSYIKQVYNENVLKILKRNVIDHTINSFISRHHRNNISSHDSPSQFFLKLFSEIGCRDESRYFNDFILQNLTIDFFAESEEDILKLKTELKNIQSNRHELENIKNLYFVSDFKSTNKEPNVNK
jgi:GTP-binding protein EngB required for normal cell division